MAAVTNLYRLAPQPGGLVVHVTPPDSRRGLCGRLSVSVPLGPGWPAADLSGEAEKMHSTICEECDAVDLTEG